MGAAVNFFAIIVIIAIIILIVWLIIAPKPGNQIPLLPQTNCIYDSDCPPSTLCASGVCSAYCIQDSDCWNGNSTGVSTCSMDQYARTVCQPQPCQNDGNCTQGGKYPNQACALYKDGNGLCVTIGTSAGQSSNPQIPCSNPGGFCYGSTNINCMASGSMNSNGPYFGSCQYNTDCGAGLVCSSNCFAATPQNPTPTTNCPTGVCQVAAGSKTSGYCSTST